MDEKAGIVIVHLVLTTFSDRYFDAWILEPRSFRKKFDWALVGAEFD
jgi:hypothetical protein